MSSTKYKFDDDDDDDDDNNNRICIAQVCRMTSEALDGPLQSCYTARARPDDDDD